MDQEYVTFATADEIGLAVNNVVRLRATNTGAVYTGTLGSGSDPKWKDLRGRVSEHPLDDLDLIEGYGWTWKAGTKFPAGCYAAGILSTQFSQVCPQAVRYDAMLDGDIVEYNAVTGFLVNVAKALKTRVIDQAVYIERQALDIERQAAQIERQAAQIERQAAQIAAQDARLSSLEARLVAVESNGESEKK